ncbi:Vmc-like lipoprotein signal peptide domain-containing protein [Ramlibacter ginsenosidimutans]
MAFIASSAAVSVSCTQR